MKKLVWGLNVSLTLSVAIAGCWIAPAAADGKKVARAKLADKAKNAQKVNGLRASKTPRAGRLLALGKDGKFPSSVLPALPVPPATEAGFGLTREGLALAANPAVLQRRIATGCAVGEAIRAIGEDGGVTCQAADITGVTAGTGLTGGGATGDVQLSLALPLDLMAANSQALLDLRNTGTGGAAELASQSSFATLYASNSGTGGTIRADTSSSGQGSAVTAYNYGVDRYAVEAELVNSTNPRAAIYARTAGNGQAIDAEVNSNTNGDALFARTTSSSASSFAGIFVGNVSISGSLAKSAGSFTIDHPLDPENKFLQHSFVESPDMKNVYDGVTTTDDRGYATVTLPDYFEALNRDFRYQLTTIRSFSRAMIAEEVEDNRFVVRTEDPEVKVSWQVTGIRKDAYANAHRIEVEPDKSPSERGRFLTPEELGYSKDRALEKR